MASAMGTHAALQPYSGLRPGEAPTIMCLACDKEQAKIVTRYSRGYFDKVPLLAGLMSQDAGTSWRWKSGSEFAVLANNFRSVRGRTVAFAVLDECAFYRSSESVSPDYETYNAIVPGMATISRWSACRSRIGALGYFIPSGAIITASRTTTCLSSGRRRRCSTRRFLIKSFRTRWNATRLWQNQSSEQNGAMICGSG